MTGCLHNIIMSLPWYVLPLNLANMIPCGKMSMMSTNHAQYCLNTSFTSPPPTCHTCKTWDPLMHINELISMLMACWFMFKIHNTLERNLLDKWKRAIKEGGNWVLNHQLIGLFVWEWKFINTCVLESWKAGRH